MSETREKFLCDAVAVSGDRKLFITVSQIGDGIEFCSGRGDPKMATPRRNWNDDLLKREIAVAYGARTVELIHPPQNSKRAYRPCARRNPKRSGRGGSLSEARSGKRLMSETRQKFLCDAVATVGGQKLFVTVYRVNDGIEFESGRGDMKHGSPRRQWTPEIIRVVAKVCGLI